MFPDELKTAHEKSRRSLIFGEKAVRHSTTPISSAAEAYRFLYNSSLTASYFIDYPLKFMECEACLRNIELKL
jgi:hypothetical protein